MDFRDENWNILTEEEVKRRGYGHLLDDAPYLRCSLCGRRTFDLQSEGKLCAMTQPNGTKCQGVLTCA